MERVLISSDAVAASGLPFSPGLRVADWVFLSGQGSLNLDNEVVGDTIGRSGCTNPSVSTGHGLPTGTVTMLFTDIEGSTRLLKQLGERYGELLAEQRRLLREAFAGHGGREMDTQGDAFFVAFARARHAVEAAVEAQRALAAHEWPDGVECRVRMGLHTGEPSVGDEGYHGLGLHRGARIAAAAHGGQVLLSSATAELVQDDLPAGMTLRDLGKQQLKDIDRPERIYQLLAEGLPSEFPPLRTGRRAKASGVARPAWRRRSGSPGRVGAVAAAIVGHRAAYARRIRLGAGVGRGRGRLGRDLPSRDRPPGRADPGGSIAERGRSR